MKKVIDGKLYNTDTADLIAEDDNGRPDNDVHHFRQELYRTGKGACFVFREGGALSSMQARSGSNTFIGSEGIEALSEDEAFELLQDWNDIEAREEYFEDRIQEA